MCDLDKINLKKTWKKKKLICNIVVASPSTLATSGGSNVLAYNK